MVMDREPCNPDSRPIYELYAKSKWGQAPKEERGLAGRIDKIFSKVLDENGRGHCVADSAGRFFGGLPVLSRIGKIPHVVGIYRLRFRISNPKNHTVTNSWRRIFRDNSAMESELEFLEGRLGLTAEEELGRARENEGNHEGEGK